MQSQRDILVRIDEKLGRQEKVLYLLLAVTFGSRAQDFIGTPPIVVLSIMATIVSTTFLLLITIAGRRIMSLPMKALMTIFLIVQFINLAFAFFPPVPDSMSIIALFRIAFAGVMMWYAVTLPTRGPLFDTEAMEQT